MVRAHFDGKPIHHLRVIIGFRVAGEQPKCRLQQQIVLRAEIRRLISKCCHRLVSAPHRIVTKLTFRYTT